MKHQLPHFETSALQKLSIENVFPSDTKLEYFKISISPRCDHFAMLAKITHEPKQWQLIKIPEIYRLVIVNIQLGSCIYEENLTLTTFTSAQKNILFSFDSQFFVYNQNDILIIVNLQTLDIIKIKQDISEIGKLYFDTNNNLFSVNKNYIIIRSIQCNTHLRLPSPKSDTILSYQIIHLFKEFLIMIDQVNYQYKIFHLLKNRKRKLHILWKYQQRFDFHYGVFQNYFFFDIGKNYRFRLWLLSKGKLIRQFQGKEQFVSNFQINQTVEIIQLQFSQNQNCKNQFVFQIVDLLRGREIKTTMIKWFKNPSVLQNCNISPQMFFSRSKYEVYLQKIY